MRRTTRQVARVLRVTPCVATVVCLLVVVLCSLVLIGPIVADSVHRMQRAKQRIRKISGAVGHVAAGVSTITTVCRPTNVSTGSYHWLKKLWKQQRSKSGTPTVFSCDWCSKSIGPALFPEHRHISAGDSTFCETVATASRSDIMIYGWRKWAPGTRGCKHEAFPGKVIFWNSEKAVGGLEHSRPDAVLSRANSIYLGPLTGQTYYPPSTHWQIHPLLVERGLDLIRRDARPKRAPRSRFLLYANGNCVDHRERAFDAVVRLSKEIGCPPPDAIGQCHGSHPELSVAAATILAKGPGTHVPERADRDDLRNAGNARLASHFRFVIAMENGVFPNYVSEKLANAFVGGCQYINAYTPLWFVVCVTGSEFIRHVNKGVYAWWGNSIVQVGQFRFIWAARTHSTSSTEIR